ncbi:MAG: DUF2975 domain-containing protein [Bacteroidales bacterium]|nr:DUF2975 domain-containing protein [Bacteroidales bacterium]
MKTPLSIKVIYWFTQIIFWLIVLVGLAILAFNILLYTDFFGNDLQLHVRLPVKMNVLEKGDLFLNGRHIKTELVDATSQIHFFNTPLFLARWFGTVMIVVSAIILYLVFIFRKFIRNVKKHKIFNIENIELLKNIAWALFALWVFAIVYMRIMYYVIARNLEFKQVEFVQEYPNFAGLLMLSLFIWVLSHVFIQGVKMKEEQDLTI